MKKPYSVGADISMWKDGMAQTITFVVTEDCNLRCKYCYITHKTSTKRMNFETAKKFIDLVLSDEINHAPAVVLEFIGGEPFLEVELIDKICDYFKMKTYEMKHPWYWNYRFSFATNGINYGTDDVQNYIKKNEGKISVGITLDGTKEKHDLQRVFPDGGGSYDTIIKNIPLYLTQFPPSTKVTFASDDLKYLKDSIINLWNVGITEVNANVVFEDVWKDGDDVIFEEQLRELAEYILENKLYDKYACSLFSDTMGGYVRKEQLEQTSCGAGKMMAVDADGKIYPCIRYKSYSLNNHEEWTVGDIENGIDMEKVRPFMVTAEKYQSDEECCNCPIASGCAHCQGFNYDVAESATNFYRAKYICKMHKAQVRANEYYFTQLYQRYGIERQNKPEKKQVYLLLADNYVTFCHYKNNRIMQSTKIEQRTLDDCLKYCYDNFFQPVLVHPKDEVMQVESKWLEEMESVHIVSADLYQKELKLPGSILYVFNEKNVDIEVEELDNCILNLSVKNVAQLAKCVEKLWDKIKRINVNLLELDLGLDEEEYKNQLISICSMLNQRFSEREINVLTDLQYLETYDNCKAGERTFVMDMKGQLYNCVGLFEEQLEEMIGTATEGVINQKDRHLYTIDYQPLCQHCDTYQCRNCIYLNKKVTREVNVSPSVQCRKSYIERSVIKEYLQMPEKEEKIVYIDPIEYLLKDEYSNVSYFKANF